MHFYLIAVCKGICWIQAHVRGRVFLVYSSIWIILTVSPSVMLATRVNQIQQAADHISNPDLKCWDCGAVGKCRVNTFDIVFTICPHKFVFISTSLFWLDCNDSFKKEFKTKMHNLLHNQHQSVWIVNVWRVKLYSTTILIQEHSCTSHLWSVYTRRWLCKYEVTHSHSPSPQPIHVPAGSQIRSNEDCWLWTLPWITSIYATSVEKTLFFKQICLESCQCEC